MPLSDLKGDRGDRGHDGDNGLDGRSIVSIEKTGTEGLLDVYTITYDRGDPLTSTFTVKNGADGNTITEINWSQDKSKLIFSFTEGEDIEVDFSELANKVINVDDGEVGQYLVIGLDSQNKKKITFENGYTEGNGINNVTYPVNGILINVLIKKEASGIGIVFGTKKLMVIDVM